MVKNPPAMQETWVQSLGQEDPWRRERLPNPVFLPGEFSEQRSLAGYSPWDQKELDTTESTHTTGVLSSTNTAAPQDTSPESKFLKDRLRTKYLKV